jgi:SIR2-like domain
MLTSKDFDNIKSGNCVLLLGAGVTVGSTRFSNNTSPILGASELAKKLARQVEIEYTNEHLREVYDAAVEKHNKDWVHTILETEYTKIKPSRNVSQLFHYPWYRVYTLNIDDSLKNTPTKDRVQDTKFINGVVTDRIEWAGRMSCQVVHLHGMAWDIKSGIVFSDEEYGQVYERRLGWYQQLREDFRTRNVYIIGSQLDEPFILSLIKREASALKDSSSATLIVPNDLSEIRRSSLARANIVHRKGTLEDFVTDIAQELGPQYSPRNIVSEETNIKELLADHFTEGDIPALQGLVKIERAHLDRLAARPASLSRRDRARFFEGYGPNWGAIADEAFSELAQFKSLDERLANSLKDARLIVVTGEAGSGKSTYVYRFAAQCATRGQAAVFHYRETSASFFSVMAALKRLVGNLPALLIVDDFRVYSDDIVSYLSENDERGITFIADSRLSDWDGRLRRVFEPWSVVARIDRFSEGDIPNIVKSIELKHVSPSFNARGFKERVDILRKSNKQILFALREASQSKIFDQIISDEVGALTNGFARAILLLISFSTSARTSLKTDVAASIVEEMLLPLGLIGEQPTFCAGIDMLPGMVDETNSGTLRVRHDLYANQVLAKHCTTKELKTVVDAITTYFSQFETPIIANINKLEGQLFKYTLNNHSLYRLFEGRQPADDTISVYSEMEQRLQLDGHYWLQYGLLLRRFGRHSDALDKFQKSIEAYNSHYASHARAQQQLIIAATLDAKNIGAARKLIETAESYLLERHHTAVSTYRDMDDDDYPISVLGNYHIDALIHIGAYQEAREKAGIYFNWISQMNKKSRYDLLKGLRERLIMLATTGRWERNVYKIGSTNFH